MFSHIETIVGGQYMDEKSLKTKKLVGRNPLEDLTIAGDYQGIGNRIKEATVSLSAADNTRISGRFFYLDIKNHKPNQTVFVDYIFKKIDRYCIPRKVRSQARKKYSELEDESVFSELHDQAIRLFIYSNKKRGAHLGEPAELIAFIILEAFLGAPQIASKMYMKTSTSMPVHGADAIHMRYYKETDCLELIWGEAKLYDNLSNGINQAVESIKSFISVDEKTGERPQKRDIEIIQDYPDVDDEDMKQAICDYFDPYSEKAGNVRHVYTCLVGYDESLYGQLVGATDSEIEEYFKAEYVKKAVNTYNSFTAKVKSEGLSELQFVLILLPFEDVNALRENFKEKLRVSPND